MRLACILLALALLALASSALAGALPIRPWADVEHVSATKRKMTVYCYPKYYRSPSGVYTETKERFVDNGDGTFSATEGVHTVTVAADGTIAASHQGRTITLRLKGFIGVADDGDVDGGAIDLNAWTFDASKIDKGRIAWTHPATGAVYSILYRADGFHDALSLTTKARAAIKKAIGATPKRVGLVFDCSLPSTTTVPAVEATYTTEIIPAPEGPPEIKATLKTPGRPEIKALKRVMLGADVQDFDHDGDIQLIGQDYKGKFMPAVHNRISAPDNPAKRVRERARFHEGVGKFVVTIPVADLDDVPELCTTVTYQQGTDSYSGCLDTHLSSGYPDTNYGTQTSLELWSVPGNVHSPLIKFDLSAIGTPASVESATLSLYAESGGAGSTAAAAQVLRDWGETTATWNKYDNANSWTTAGCGSVGNDRNAFGATVTCNAANYSWTDFDITAIAKNWLVSSQANYGVFIQYVDLLTVRYWYARDHATVGGRPKLTIDYTAAAAYHGYPWPLLDPMHGGFQR